MRAVQPQLPAADTRSQQLAQLSLGDLRDLTDYREALEGGAAALAARRSIEHITELQPAEQVLGGHDAVSLQRHRHDPRC